MKTIAFGASGSRNSINQQFAEYVARQIDANAEIININDFPLPLYSIDLEHETGIPENVDAFYNKIASADRMVISLAEHNGSYTTMFKNLFDWLSRKEVKFFSGKQVLLLATSPGGRGAKSVLEAALIRFPIHGAEIIGHFSLPFFEKNFNEEKGIVDEELKKQLNDITGRLYPDYLLELRCEG